MRFAFANMWLVYSFLKSDTLFFIDRDSSVECTAIVRFIYEKALITPNAFFIITIY